MRVESLRGSHAGRGLFDLSCRGECWWSFLFNTEPIGQVVLDMLLLQICCRIYAPWNTGLRACNGLWRGAAATIDVTRGLRSGPRSPSLVKFKLTKQINQGQWKYGRQRRLAVRVVSISNLEEILALKASTGSQSKPAIARQSRCTSPSHQNVPVLHPRGGCQA